MSYLGNASDMDSDKNEFPARNRSTSALVSKLAAHKLSSEPKWQDKRENDSDSEISSAENFLTKDDYQAVYKKGFHKVTGARFYRKITIPCRPRKTFTLYVLDVPEELPCEDIRHALYKYDSVVEVVRLHVYNQPATATVATDKNTEASQSSKTDAAEKPERPERRDVPPSVIRITLASMDEYNILLQNGLNFYDATFFPTEANITFKGAKLEYKRRMLDGNVAGRVRELLPVFDAAGFCKLPAPTSKLIKPPRS